MAAQQGPFTPPPAVLQIGREFMRPGKAQAVAQIERDGVAEAARLNNPHPWLALASVSGRDDHWFLSGYDSYAAVDQEYERVGAIPAVARLFAEMPGRKAELLIEPRIVFARYREDLSYSRGLTAAHTRFFLVTTVQIHPGHGADFAELRRIVRGGHQRARAADNISVYEVDSGMPDGTFLIFSAAASFDEAGALSQFHGRGLENALSPQDRTRLRDLSNTAIESSETVLFSVDPSMSYPAQEWIQADVEFWRGNPVVTRR